jgi:Holliday junction resolvasome RuvABC endonuclease subunit
MKLLALDQASRTSGFAVFEDNKLIKYGKFTFDDTDFGIRLMKIRDKVKSLIDEFSVDKVVFEDIQLQDNVDTFKKLAEVFGVIFELVTELNIPHEAILASSWKSTLKIKGTKRPEQKKNAQLWVVENYNIKPTQDECDAICIGVHAIRNKPAEVFDWSD